MSCASQEIDCSQEVEEKCIVCYNSSAYADIPCGHKCCVDCLREWFKKAQTCPMCRQKLSKSCLPTPVRKRQRPQNVINLVDVIDFFVSEEIFEVYTDSDEDYANSDEDYADSEEDSIVRPRQRRRVAQRQRNFTRNETKSDVLLECTLNYMLENGQREYLRGDINRALQHEPRIIALYPTGCRDKKKYLDGSFQTIELNGALENAGIYFEKRGNRMFYFLY